MIKAFIQKTAVAGITQALLTAALVACSNDPYDSGDGSLSYMRADFVEASTNGDAKVVSATTDDGKQLQLSPMIGASWITAKDSTYRALLYYNDKENGNADADNGGKGRTASPVAIADVLVPKIVGASAVRNYPTDPVTLDTSWLSRNKRYINLGIYIKTGTKGGKVEAQSIGIVYNGTRTMDDGTRVHMLTLIHGQNNVPEYYSSQVYISIPLYRLPFATSEGDMFEITVNTYKGQKTKSFII